MENIIKTAQKNMSYSLSRARKIFDISLSDFSHTTLSARREARKNLTSEERNDMMLLKLLQAMTDGAKRKALREDGSIDTFEDYLSGQEWYMNRLKNLLNDKALQQTEVLFEILSLVSVEYVDYLDIIAISEIFACRRISEIVAKVDALEFTSEPIPDVISEKVLSNLKLGRLIMSGKMILEEQADEITDIVMSRDNNTRSREDVLSGIVEWLESCCQLSGLSTQDNEIKIAEMIELMMKSEDYEIDLDAFI